MFQKKKARIMAVLAAASMAVSVFAQGADVHAAGKTEMYVLTKAKEGYFSSYDNSNTPTSLEKFTYDSSGLMTSYIEYPYSVSITTGGWQKDKKARSWTSCHYEQGKLISLTGKTRTDKYNKTFSFDNKNRLKSVKGQRKSLTNTSIGKAKDTVTLSYSSNGKLKKIVQKDGNSLDDTKSVTTFDFDGNGQLIKETRPMLAQTFTYDANGNINSAFMTSDDETSQTVFTNTYDNKNCLVRREGDTDGFKSITEYTYKKVNVPAKYVKIVKAQQMEALSKGLMALDILTLQ